MNGIVNGCLELTVQWRLNDGRERTLQHVYIDISNKESLPEAE